VRGRLWGTSIGPLTGKEKPPSSAGPIFGCTCVSTVREECPRLRSGSPTPPNPARPPLHSGVNQVSDCWRPADPKSDNSRQRAKPPTDFWSDSSNREFASIAKLRVDLETVPSVTIERAAELLDLSVRTLYRRRREFEHKRQKRHLYFTLRGIKQYIEIEQYNSTTSFDITICSVLEGGPGSGHTDNLNRPPSTPK
jgi:hypothetical protein